MTFMSLDRVLSLSKPFFYKQHASPCLTRTFCIFLTMFCLILAAFPFAGGGRYTFNESSRSFCQFDWFPTTLVDTVYILAIAACGVFLTSLMTLSNIIVFIIVVRIRRRMAAVLPSEMNARRRARRITFGQEERMAKFVALVSIVFLVTWLPVTVSSCAYLLLSNPSLDFAGDLRVQDAKLVSRFKIFIACSICPKKPNLIIIIIIIIKNIFMQDDHFSYKNCYQHGSCD